jgi:hypothetical protein
MEEEGHVSFDMYAHFLDVGRPEENKEAVQNLQKASSWMYGEV